MLIVDSIVLDPSEFVPGGVELDLAGEGFRVTDAPFAEADVEIEMQRAEFGETPTNWHPPNQSIPLTLEILDEGEVNRVQAFAKLQQKIGKFNQFGEHWMRRDFKYEGAGKVAGSLGKRVYKATCPDLSAWGRGQLPDAVLTLVTGPYWYSTVEVESTTFTEEDAREMVFELASVLGTSPGLIRIRIKNTGEADWRGLILAGESRDHPQDATADTTAALSYPAADLTLKGGSEVKEVEGVNVVENDELTAGWLSILNSEHGEHGHMTHVGVRRPWIRAEALEGDAEDIQLKLRWRPLGAVNWSENRIVPLNIVGDYQLYDLGEARPERAALGDQRWEWSLQARALSGAGKVRLHRVEVLPTEQYAVVRSPYVTPAADLQSQKSPGEGSQLAFGPKEWTNAGNILAPDSSYATVKLGGTKSEVSKWLWAKSMGFVLPEAAVVTSVIVRVQREATSANAIVDASSGGCTLVVAGEPVGQPIRSPSPWSTGGEEIDYVFGADSLTEIGGLTGAQVNANTFGAAVSAAPLGEAEQTAKVDYIRITVYYTEAADENRVCFAGRSIEFRSDGIFRQHPSDDAWGELIPVGSGGLHSMPSGLEERKSRYVVIASQGDLSLIDHPGGELPDAGDNPLEAQTFDRPAYLASREAA